MPHFHSLAAIAFNVLGAVAMAFNFAISFNSSAWKSGLTFLVGLLAGLTTVGVNIYRFFLLRQLKRQHEQLNLRTQQTLDTDQA